MLNRLVLKRVPLVALVLIAVVACESSRPFRTHAVYRAPKSGLRVVVFSEGVVPSGADVADGFAVTAVFCPSLKGARALRLDVLAASRGAPPPHARYAIEGGGSGTLNWDFRTWDADLTRALSLAGVTAPDAAEVTELVKEVRGVGGGPKSTVMLHQTHATDVVDVAFESGAPSPTFAACSGGP